MVDCTPLDWAIVAAVAASTALGLFRGFSGEAAAFAGLALAVCAAWFLFPQAEALAPCLGVASPYSAAGRAASVAIDAVFACVAWGVGRRLVARLVAFAVPRPLDVCAGAAIGFARALVFVAVLLAAGFVQTGSCARGFCAERSAVLASLGLLADMYVSEVE